MIFLVIKTICKANDMELFVEKSFSIITEHDGITLSNGDFNKDGIIDLALVSASSNSLIFYKGDGKGKFHPW